MTDWLLSSREEYSLVANSNSSFYGGSLLTHSVIQHAHSQLEVFRPCFSSEEEEVLRCALSQLWCGGSGESLSQESLLAQLSELHQDRIHRLLSRALLYCGQYPDTRVYSSHCKPSYHLLIIREVVKNPQPASYLFLYLLLIDSLLIVLP